MTSSSGRSAELVVSFQGHVGHPMPGVVVRLLAESGEDVTTKIGEPGEIQVKGANVFIGYWNDAAVTEKEHCVDQDGQRWFKTGDFGLRDTDEDGGFRVLGRNSVDIIKVRPCLPSALENPSS
jgi:malonyl-CoA/methylmalonyl-CoA synthetase